MISPGKSFLFIVSSFHKPLEAIGNVSELLNRNLETASRLCYSH